jgi:ankyrin repeat protein
MNDRLNTWHPTVRVIYSKVIPTPNVAAEKSYLEVVKYLIAQMFIAAYNQVSLAGCLLQAKVFNPIDTRQAMVNQARDTGVTPLYVAAQQGHLAVVKYLITQGKAAVNQACQDGATPLYVAARKGYLEVVRYLIERGQAAINQVCKDGATPLCIAVCYDHLEVVQYLVSQQADVYQAHNQGITALHFAVQQKHTDIIKLLITVGALLEREQALTPLLTLPNKAGFTPLDYADASNKEALLAWHRQRFFLANDYWLRHSPATHFAQHNLRFFAYRQKPLADCDIGFAAETRSPQEVDDALDNREAKVIIGKNV